MERLQTFGFVRAIDPDARRVTSVVSTDAVARDGAIIETAGWNLEHYQKNPVVLWAHDDHSMPIAKTVETIRTEHELIQVHEFAQHPFADQVFAGIRGGFVNATSVRWLPGETEMRNVGDGKNRQPVLVFKNGHQLLESSYVPIPADPGAVVLRADGSPIDKRAYYAPGVDDVIRCQARECRNETDGGALCDECAALLDTARAAAAAPTEARAARAAKWAEKFRATTQSLKGEAA